MSPLHSLRWRLIVSIVLGMSTVLGVGGWIAYRHVKKELYAEFDRGLSARSGSITSMIETEMGFVDFEWIESGAKHPPGYQEGEEVFQIWSSTDLVLGKTPLLGKTDLPRELGAMRVEVPGGKDWRGLGIRFVANTEVEEDGEPAFDEEELAELIEKGYVRLAEPATMDMMVARVDTVRPALASIFQLILGVWFITTLVAAALIWFLVRQNLKPLDSLRQQIGDLQSGGLSDRVNLTDPPQELTPVVEELNRLLARVQDTLRREKNLTSNVAHELRTPIAGLLSTLEVTLSRERESEAYREASEDCLEIAKRMHWLVNNLLSIARVEAGNVELHDHIVELSVSLEEWWIPFAESAANKELNVEWEIDCGARVETDPEFLRVVISNLFDNAVSYTMPGGTIVIRAKEGVISVGNDVVDLSPEVANRVFEPFWRNEESREECGVHVGLGLSLCQKIVGILGGNIAIELPEAGQHFEVRLRFAA